MWSASPQISWMTTTAPRGDPLGSARYAVRSCSGRSIIVPMPHSYPLVPGRGCEDGVVPTQPAAVTRALAHVRGLSTGRPLDPTLRVTLNFHPDRLVRGEPVLAVMARDGVYRSQFETGTGNGGLTAHPGGSRWRWESRIFGGAYDDAPSHERPVYGSLNHRGRAVGGSVRFGSSHLRLTAEALHRATFCYPDSYLEPLHFGTARAMGLAALADA